MSSGFREDLSAHGHSPFTDHPALTPGPDTNVHAGPSASVPGTPPLDANPPGIENPTPIPGTPATLYTNPFSTPARGSYVGDATPSPLPTRLILEDDAPRNASDIPVPVLSEKGPIGTKRRPLFIWLGIGAAAIVVIVLAVVLPVFFTVIRNHPSSSGGARGSASNPESPTGATTGGDGSVITLANGTSFTYTNTFGGFCTSSLKYRFSVANVTSYITSPSPVLLRSIVTSNHSRSLEPV